MLETKNFMFQTIISKTDKFISDKNPDDLSVPLSWPYSEIYYPKLWSRGQDHYIVTAIEAFSEPAVANLCKIVNRRQKFWLAPRDRLQKPEGSTIRSLLGPP